MHLPFSQQYEWNARTQVTMWFDTNDTTQSKLHDYGKDDLLKLAMLFHFEFMFDVIYLSGF